LLWGTTLHAGINVEPERAHQDLRQHLKGVLMKSILTSLALGLALGFPALAESNHPAHAGAAEHTTPLSEGVVKKVDKAQGKLTLKHGPLENLDMPGMTMVFRVQDAGWLDQVKPGDTIRFRADRMNGTFTVTMLEVVKP
jgi:Cu/Ag efflux protein CusF